MLFDNSQYKRSHGHAPRGRGGWAFRFWRDGVAIPNPNRGSSRPDEDMASIFWARVDGSSSLFYSDAKRWAGLKARELGADVVEVCP